MIADNIRDLMKDVVSIVKDNTYVENGDMVESLIYLKFDDVSIDREIGELLKDYVNEKLKRLLDGSNERLLDELPF